MKVTSKRSLNKRLATFVEVTRVRLFLHAAVTYNAGTWIFVNLLCRQINHLHSTIHCTGRFRTGSPDLFYSFPLTPNPWFRKRTLISVYDEPFYTSSANTTLKKEFFWRWLKSNIISDINCGYLGDQRMKSKATYLDSIENAYLKKTYCRQEVAKYLISTNLMQLFYSVARKSSCPVDMNRIINSYWI